MPNSGDMTYQVEQIQRKVLVISGNERLTPVERELLEDITEEHLLHIVAFLREHTTYSGTSHSGSAIACPICQSALDQAGKCPKRGDEEHLKLTTLNSRQDNSLPSG